MKIFPRQPHQGRYGYAAWMLFLLAYTATIAVVIAPEHVKLAMDILWTWLFE